jgi:hypothetical protein
MVNQCQRRCSVNLPGSIYEKIFFSFFLYLLTVSQSGQQTSEKKAKQDTHVLLLHHVENDKATNKRFDYLIIS